MLFIVEDLHWTDPSTLELLNLVIEQIPTASICVLLTCRSHFQPTWHHRSYLTEMTVHRLSHTQVAQIVTRMTDGKTFPYEVLQQIIAKTDGVPLFVEEMTKAILELGQLTTVDGHYELIGSLSTFAIPATLHDSLMARLDHLVTAKAVAQLAAVIGRQFAYDILQAVSHMDEVRLQHELGRLVEAEIVYQRGTPPQATYVFKHALIQDAAYASLLKSTRQQLHQQLAQVLEARPETAETQPELLAHHYTEAGLAEQAVRYWQRAGQRTAGRSAHAEAIGHFRQALEVLVLLPDTSARARQELTLQRALGASLLTTRGFAAPEVEHVYSRARALCQQLGDTREIFPVLFGLFGFYEVRGDLRTARELAEQLLTLAQRQHDPALLLQGHRVQGELLFHLGELVPARAHLEQGIALYNPQQHRTHASLYGQDPGMGCRVFAALVLWVLGYPNQALQRGQEGLSLAHELSHPLSLAMALSQVSRLHGLRREWPAAQERAEVLMALAREQGFPQQLATSLVHWGWTLAAQGRGEESIPQIHQGLAAYQVTGAEISRAQYLALLAEACGTGGQPAEGLRVLAEAVTVAHNIGERWFEAERHRLKGELLLALSVDNQVEAEACFQQALTVARQQQAKSWELRVAMSLSRLWQSQGKRQAAHDLLAPVYGWFTEGFDTADLQDAKALLDALG
jgi:predicted ATPase